MNVLTPNGYKDITDLEIGDEVTVFDTDTGIEGVNHLVSKELFTKERFESQQIPDPTHVPAVIGQDENGDDVFEEQRMIQDCFDFYLINGTFKLFKNQNIWRNKGDWYCCVHAFDLVVGDVIYTDLNQDLAITSVEKIDTETEWWRLEIDGDHSYIADGLTFHNASQYWSANANWTTSTGWWTDDSHTVNGSIPSTSDNAMFTASSGGTCTMTGTVTIYTLDCTGYTSNLIGNRSLVLNGAITVPSSMGTFTISGLTLNSTTSQNLTISKPIPTLNVNSGYSANFTLQADLTLSGVGATTFYIGSSTPQFVPNGYAVIFTGSTPGILTSATQTFYNLTWDPSGSSRIDAFSINGQNVIVTNVLSITGTSASYQALFYSDNSTYGSNRTITLSGSATANITNCNFWNIIGAGSGGNTWFASNTLTGCGDCGNNSGLLFPTGITCYCKMTANSAFSNAGIWFDTTNGGGSAVRIPLPQDTIRVDSNSGSYALSLDMPSIGTLDCSGNSTSTVTKAVAFRFSGSMTLTSTIGFTGNYEGTYVGDGTATLTSATKSMYGLTIYSFQGTLQHGDNCTITSGRTVTHQAGTYKMNSYTVQCSIYNYGKAFTRVLDLDTGVLRINNTSAATRITGTGISGWSLSRTTGYIYIYSTNAGLCTLALRTMTIPYLRIGGTTAFTVYQSSSGGGETVGYYFDSTPASGTWTVQFLVSVTHYVSALSGSGTSGHLITFATSSNGVASTLNYTPSVPTTGIDYYSFQDITGSADLIWYVGANSTLVSGNTYIYASAYSAPTSGVNSNFLQFFN